MSIEIVNAGPARETSTGVKGGIDVDVTVRVGDDLIEGGVTLAPAQHDGRLAAYGNSPDTWISGALLARLYQLSDSAFRQALEDLEGAAVDAAS